MERSHSYKFRFFELPTRGGLAGRAVRADARREKVRESMETFAYLSILPTDLHFLQFVGRFGQIVLGPKNIASPPLLPTEFLLSRELFHSQRLHYFSISDSFEVDNGQPYNFQYLSDMWWISDQTEEQHIKNFNEDFQTEPGGQISQATWR